MPLARALATTLLLTAFAAAGPQSGQQNPIAPARQGNPNPFPATSRESDPDPNLQSVEQRQQKARNDERQKRLVADTEKLLALATQLHEDVGKTNKNILSLDVVKRSDEIEKLAHNIKERMKG